MADEQEKKEDSPTLKFTYKKSNSFRVIRADGAWGGFAPHGDIVMSLFNERPAIPNMEEYPILEDGALGKPPVKKITESEGIIREVEVAINLSPETALNVAKWLLAKVRQFEVTSGIELEQEDFADKK